MLGVFFLLLKGYQDNLKCPLLTQKVIQSLRITVLLCGCLVGSSETTQCSSPATRMCKWSEMRDGARDRFGRGCCFNFCMWHIALWEAIPSQNGGTGAFPASHLARVGYTLDKTHTLMWKREFSQDSLQSCLLRFADIYLYTAVLRSHYNLSVWLRSGQSVCCRFGAGMILLLNNPVSTKL